MIKNWERRRRLSNEIKKRVARRVSVRVELLLARGCLYQGFSTPIEKATDEELLKIYGIGAKSLAEIRKVFPIARGASEPVAVSTSICEGESESTKTSERPPSSEVE